MTQLYKQKYRTQTVRLKYYDYASNGAYFVTICTKNRANFFGKLENEKMVLSEIGNLAKKCFAEIPRHFPNTKLGEFVIMEDHFYGVIFIDKNEVLEKTQNDFKKKFNNTVKTENFLSLPRSKNEFQKVIPRSLSSIIRGFKTGVTKFANKNNLNFAWQQNYYERIIRNETELEKISDYIRNNSRLHTKKKDNFLYFEKLLNQS